jgi:hypothetical protein
MYVKIQIITRLRATLIQVVHLPQYASLFGDRRVRGAQLLHLTHLGLVAELGVRIRLHMQRVVMHVGMLKERGADGRINWVYNHSAFQAGQQRLRDWVLNIDPSTEPQVMCGFETVVVDYQMLPFTTEADLEKDVGLASMIQREPFRTSLAKIKSETSLNLASLNPPSPHASRVADLSSSELNIPEHQILSEEDMEPRDYANEEHAIGQGAFGEVFRATLRGRAVAVKRLKHENPQVCVGTTELNREVHFTNLLDAKRIST